MRLRALLVQQYNKYLVFNTRDKDKRSCQESLSWDIQHAEPKFSSVQRYAQTRQTKVCAYESLSRVTTRAPVDRAKLTPI